MRKFIVLFCALSPVYLFAQNWHLTAFGGISNYQGDLQEKRVTTSQAHGAFGLGIQYTINQHIILRSGLTYCKISGDDKLAENNGLRLRNLNFTSRLLEFNLLGEYDFLKLETYKFTPYVFGGFAVFGFDPYTKDTLGNVYYLQPLGTEGQGLAAYPDKKPYHRVQLSIPFGAGIKLRLNELMTVGYEFGLRKTFTDYLDDISSQYADQSTLLAAKGPKAVELAYRGGELKDGNPAYPAAGTIRGGEKIKDWYYFQGITLSYRLGAKPGSNSSKRKSLGHQLDCPRNVY
jgi:hypothetical protein